MTRSRTVESGPATAVQIVGYDVPPIGVTYAIHTPPVNTLASVGYNPAGRYSYHVFGGVSWSYNGPPTGGNLQIIDGIAGVIFDIDITHSGPGFIPFTPALRGSQNATLTVRLAPAGAAVSGKINVLGHWVETFE